MRRTLPILALCLFAASPTFADDTVYFGSRVTLPGFRKIVAEIGKKFKQTPQDEFDHFLVPAIDKKFVYHFNLEKDSDWLQEVNQILNLKLNLKKGLPVWLHVNPIQSRVNGNPDQIILHASEQTTYPNANHFYFGITTILTDLQFETDQATVCDRANPQAKDAACLVVDHIKLEQDSKAPPIQIEFRVEVIHSPPPLTDQIEFKVSFVSSNLDQYPIQYLKVDPAIRFQLPNMGFEGENGFQLTYDSKSFRKSVLDRKHLALGFLLKAGTQFITSRLETVLNQLLAQKTLPDNLHIETSAQIKAPASPPKKKTDFVAELLQSLEKETHQLVFNTKMESFNLDQEGGVNVKYGMNLSVDRYSQKLDPILHRCNCTASHLRELWYPSSSYDFALAISEPLINQTLQMFHQSGIVNRALNEMKDYHGITIGSDSIRFFINAFGDQKISMLLDAQIFYKDLQFPIPDLSEGTKNKSIALLAWFEKYFGSGKSLRVPVQIDFVPSIVKNPVTNEYELQLKVQNPIDKDPIEHMTLKNEYGCTSNYKEATPLFRTKIGNLVADIFDKNVKSTQSIRLQPLLNKLPLQINPKEIRISPSGYLILLGDFGNLDWSKIERKE